MAKTTRTNISIPIELKARMEAAGDDVNWSAVACRAFERELAEIIARKGTGDMKDVVSRLRASRMNLEDARYKEGFEDGQGWAKEYAEAHELQRLKAIRERLWRGGEWEYTWSSGGDSAWGPDEHFVFTIRPEVDGDRGEAASFWELYAGDDHEALSADGDYVRGFAEGALDVWSEVEPQL